MNVIAQARLMIYNTLAAWAPEIEHNPNLVANIPLMIYSTLAAMQQARLVIYNTLVGSPKSRPQLVW